MPTKRSAHIAEYRFPSTRSRLVCSFYFLYTLATWACLGISVAKVVRSINISTQSAVSSHSHSLSFTRSLSLFLAARAIPFSLRLYLLSLSSRLSFTFPSPRVLSKQFAPIWARVLSDCRDFFFDSSLLFSLPFRPGACRSEGD